MYSKCGNIREAKRLFGTILMEKLLAYNSGIPGYANHGHADEALALCRHLEEGQEDGIESNEITLTNILSACSHSHAHLQSRPLSFSVLTSQSAIIADV